MVAAGKTKPPGRSWARRLVAAAVVVTILGIGVAWLASAVRVARIAARASQSTWNLKQIALAVANHHETYGCFPPAYVADRDGKPMHSWRVLILPFLEQRALYDAYDFAEPWDGPNNHKLADRVGQIYLWSGLESDQVRATSFVAVVGPGTAWRGVGSLSYKDLEDGSHDTLIVVEVPDAQFLWMEPRDLRFDRMSFRINDGSGRGPGSRLGGARVVSADGSVRTLPDGFDPVKFRAMMTADGGEQFHE